MSNISFSDNLFISATAMGVQFYNYIGRGISSLGDIITMVRNSPDIPHGMVTLTVRNASKGWAQSQSFYNA